MVSTVEQAFEVKRQDSSCLLIGEVNGLPIEGFDFPNSPSAIESLNLDGQRLVQRTTAGTQGVVLSSRANHLFVASLCVATATANTIRSLNPQVVTFVETGVRPKGGGEEDTACADFISSKLLNTSLSNENIETRVLGSAAAAKFANSNDIDFPATDLDHALKIDHFNFSMKVEKANNLLTLKPSYRIINR